MEPNSGLHPVKMVSTIQDERLAQEPRINYSRPMFIEHNAKVFFIGHIAEGDLDTFQCVIEKAWATKRSKKYRLDDISDCLMDI